MVRGLGSVPTEVTATVEGRDHRLAVLGMPGGWVTNIPLSAAERYWSAVTLSCRCSSAGPSNDIKVRVDPAKGEPGPLCDATLTPTHQAHLSPTDLTEGFEPEANFLRGLLEAGDVWGAVELTARWGADPRLLQSSGLLKEVVAAAAGMSDLHVDSAGLALLTVLSALPE